MTRGAVDVIPEKDLRKKIQHAIDTDTPLRIKAGFDPTAPDLHLGHTVLLHKLRHFQEMGHQVIFLIGDYTACIGDPSGRSALRPPLTREEVEKNASTYKEQVFKILDPDETEVRYNSEWMDKMSGADMIGLASHYTVARMLERDDFSKRYAAEKPISIHEFLYPLVQGYDSVALKADVEIGGQDQRFNLLVGRNLQEAHHIKHPQALLMMPLLVGLDGVQKMSKSYGNAIGITDEPNDMFGKVMSISDELMVSYYELLSAITTEELETLKKGMASGELNPKATKETLAMEIVDRYHGEGAGAAAREHFNTVHARGGVPDDVPEMKLAAGENKRLLDVIVEAGFAASNKEAKRKIQQGGVSIDDAKVEDIAHELPGSGEHLVKVGKRHFVKVIFE
ncbi:MAG: tyrosine--tRNA ligase [Chrysiogenetes bacterium]|nr:tyrosine--tRNA ligase [Chrysiogenetes bacterium]